LSNEFKARPRNLNLSHGHTFDTTARPSILVPFLEEELTFSFYAIERIYLKRKVGHKKKRDWKCHVLF
jgi:hypothetical protein